MFLLSFMYLYDIFIVQVMCVFVHPSVHPSVHPIYNMSKIDFLVFGVEWIQKKPSKRELK